ncbi:MAG: type I-B CRISPR-associated protein Cas7/Cst2/DevR [Candidatus Sigynarchaeota archaeon]
MAEKMKYIAGTFLIQANEAFLNGGGSSGMSSEDQNLVQPKFMWVNGKQVPYVSSQAWKHWLRDTLIQETKWPASRLRAIGWNEKGNTAKIAGMLNPIDYPEDDIFGYMYAFTKEQKKLTEEQKAIVDTLPSEQLVRPAVFLASLLAAIQTKGTISRDEAFVHLKESSNPLPYTTAFYNADLNAIFGIDLSRLGVFDNLEAKDKELDPVLAEKALAEKKIEIVKSGKQKKPGIAIYRKSDLAGYQKNVVFHLLNALAHLQGGAKMAQFGVDITPKVIVAAGLNFKAPIFSNLFEMGTEKPRLKVALLKELISDYKDRLQTPVFIGLRTGYLENEEEIRKLVIDKEFKDKLVLSTPVEIAAKIRDSV